MPSEKEPEFTWYVGEDADLPTLESSEPSPGPRAGRRRLYLVIGMFLGTIILIGAMYIHVRVKEAQLRRDFQAVVDREWQIFTTDFSGAQSLVTEGVRPDEVFRPWVFYSFFYTIPSLSPPRVVSVTLQDGGTSAWVLQEMGGDVFRTPCRWVAFYRLTDAGWKRTAPDKRFWGKEVEGQSPHIHWRSYEREARIARRESEELESMYIHISSYLPPESVPTLIPVEYDIAYDSANVPFTRRELRFPVFYLWGVTPDERACPEPRLLLLYETTAWMLDETVGLRREIQAPKASTSMLLAGLRAYFVERTVTTLAPDLQPVWTALASWENILVSNAGPPPNIEDLRWNTPYAVYYSRLLVAYIAERYGPSGVANLVRALKGDAVSVKAILLSALGQDLDSNAFNREWHAYIEAYQQAHPPATLPVSPVPTSPGP